MTVGRPRKAGDGSMKKLTLGQVDAYQRDGFLFPIDGLGAAETGKYRLEFGRYEEWLGQPLPQADLKWRGLTYLLMPWVDELVRHPAILDAVEDVIGPDILLYMATFFIKEAKSPSFTAWHQDATYFGLTPHEHVTAWVALTDASAQAGCMEVVSSNGKPRQLRHEELRSGNSINSRGQTITEAFDKSTAVAMALDAGQFSLHHTLCAHRSEPNGAEHRRIGLGISYMPAHVKHTGELRMPAVLVRGSDRYGHFDLMPRPSAFCDEASVALHDSAYRRYRASYEEQAALHARIFPPGERAAELSQSA